MSSSSSNVTHTPQFVVFSVSFVAVQRIDSFSEYRNPNWWLIQKEEEVINADESACLAARFWSVAVESNGRLRGRDTEGDYGMKLWSRRLSDTHTHWQVNNENRLMRRKTMLNRKYNVEKWESGRMHWKCECRGNRFNYRWIEGRRKKGAWSGEEKRAEKQTNRSTENEEWLDFDKLDSLHITLSTKSLDHNIDWIRFGRKREHSCKVNGQEENDDDEEEEEEDVDLKPEDSPLWHNDLLLDTAYDNLSNPIHQFEKNCFDAWSWRRGE